MSKKISELTAGTTLTGAEQLEIVQSATSKRTTAQEVVASTFTVTASGTDTYTATLSPALTAYTTNHKYYVKFTNANTGAATLNLNGLGAKAIRKSGTTALSSGDIAAGQIIELVYDGTNFQIVGGGSGSGSGSTIASGLYTPTLSNTTNVSSSVAFECQYMRIDNVVTVSGMVTITASGAGNTVLRMSLPIASNFGALEQCAGTHNQSSGTENAGVIYAGIASDTAEFNYTAVSTSALNRLFTFTYRII